MIVQKEFNLCLCERLSTTHADKGRSNKVSFRTSSNCEGHWFHFLHCIKKKTWCLGWVTAGSCSHQSWGRSRHSSLLPVQGSWCPWGAVPPHRILPSLRFSSQWGEWEERHCAEVKVACPSAVMAGIACSQLLSLSRVVSKWNFGILKDQLAWNRERELWKVLSQQVQALVQKWRISIEASVFASMCLSGSGTD